MSTVESPDHTVPTAVLDGAVEEYPRDKLYILTALFLAVVTATEVATYAWPSFKAWHWSETSSIGIITVLLLLMAVKFFTVAYIFMHLKFDKPILTRLFYAGLGLAILVYLAVMLMFRIYFPGQHI